jgi:hypothetical protein
VQNQSATNDVARESAGEPFQSRGRYKPDWEGTTLVVIHRAGRARKSDILLSHYGHTVLERGGCNWWS